MVCSFRNPVEQQSNPIGKRLCRRPHVDLDPPQSKTRLVSLEQKPHPALQLQRSRDIHDSLRLELTPAGPIGRPSRSALGSAIDLLRPALLWSGFPLRFSSPGNILHPRQTGDGRLNSPNREGCGCFGGRSVGHGLLSKQSPVYYTQPLMSRLKVASYM